MATKCRPIPNFQKKQVKKSDHVYENLTYKDNKLKIVIDNFDKILDEYKATPSTKIPKLQKAKTCSIIESKCILKKTLSQPETPAKVKTKSLAEIPQIQKGTKVRQVVEKINLLSNKSKSINDVSVNSERKSRIPVKTPSLRKIFPSTPSGLNCLDRSGSTKIQPKRDFVNSKEKSVKEVIQKLENDKLGNGRATYRRSTKCEKVKVKLSYSSDDNSDDSGHISNEIEGDCDDVGQEKVNVIKIRK